MSDRKYVCDIDVKGIYTAKIVAAKDSLKDIYAIELFIDGHSDGVYEPDALSLLARTAADGYQGPMKDMDDFFRLCRTAIELVHHLEQGKPLHSFDPYESPVEVSSYQKHEQERDQVISH